MPENVAVLGASDNPSRFAHQCMLSLAEHGHKVLPVNPGHDLIDSMRCYPDLGACPGPIDTVTVYVRPAILRGMLQEVVDARPARVILNPGTEDAAVISRLQAAGIYVQSACTLVLLNTGRYTRS